MKRAWVKWPDFAKFTVLVLEEGYVRVRVGMQSAV